MESKVVSIGSSASEVKEASGVGASGPMSASEVKGTSISERRKAISSAIDEAGIAINQAAREAGLSAGTVSQFLKGTYNGNNANVAEQLEHWLEHRRARRDFLDGMPEEPEWYETSTSRKAFATLAYAHNGSRMACFYGPPGLGKTKAIRQYAAQHQNVWIVTATPATSDLTSILQDIAEAVGLGDVPCRQRELLRGICAKVRGTGGLLIIDESQHLKQPALEGIRSLFDCTHAVRGRGIGMVLCGNEYVYARLRGKNEAVFAQLFSRISRRTRVDEITGEDADALSDAWKIRGKAERDLIRRICVKHGALRTGTEVLRQAALLADGQPVTVTQITAAWQNLGVALE